MTQHKELIERLHSDWTKVYEYPLNGNASRLGREAADVIEAQARENAELRVALGDALKGLQDASAAFEQIEKMGREVLPHLAKGADDDKTQ